MNLYNVKINYKGEIHDIYTNAISQLQAIQFAIQRIAKQLGYRKVSPIRQWINGGAGRVEVTLVEKKA